jgi:hypothetical protein
MSLVDFLKPLCHRRLSNNFQDHRWILEKNDRVIDGNLKRITGRIEASRNFMFNLLDIKAATNCEIHQQSCKSTDLICKNLKKILISRHYPFLKEEAAKVRRS